MYFITTNLMWLFPASLLPAATAFLGDNPTLPQDVMIWSAASGLVLANIAHVFSVYPSWVLIFFACCLQWIPGRYVGRVLGVKPASPTTVESATARE